MPSDYVAGNPCIFGTSQPVRAHVSDKSKFAQDEFFLVTPVPMAAAGPPAFQHRPNGPAGSVFSVGTRPPGAGEPDSSPPRNRPIFPCLARCQPAIGESTQPGGTRFRLYFYFRVRLKLTRSVWWDSAALACRRFPVPMGPPCSPRPAPIKACQPQFILPASYRNTAFLPNAAG